MFPELTYTSEQTEANWFYEKHFFADRNPRYYTFQLALNLLSQLTDAPIIIETGCQRLHDDLGDGRSTTVFGEYVSRYGGKVITIDLSPQNLATCKAATRQWSDHIEYVQSDSVSFLRAYDGQSPDLVYLDSFDYPIEGEDKYDEKRRLAQEHSLNEFMAIEPRLHSHTILLTDDNMLPGGGKPRLLKVYLAEKRWLCLFDLQQSLWIPPTFVASRVLQPMNLQAGICRIQAAIRRLRAARKYG